MPPRTEAPETSGLWRGIVGLYTSPDVESTRNRGAHLHAVMRLTPYTMAANIGSGALVLWAFRAPVPLELWIWWTALLVLSGLGLARWWPRRSRAPGNGSPRAMHHATAHAALLAGLWAYVPLLWFPGANAAQQITVATLITGMLGAGAFVLSPLPLASLVYAAIYSVASVAALWRHGDPHYAGVAMLLLLYGPMVMIASLNNWAKATVQLRARAEAVRRERLLTLLLQDFEHQAGEALWETDVGGRLIHLSPRMAEFLGATEAEIWECSFLSLLERRCVAGAEGLRAALASGHSFRDLQISLSDGASTNHFALNGKRLLDDKGRLLGWRGVLANVTARIEGERRLRQLAHTDSLTGLANRFMLGESLQAQVQARQSGALLSLDLDNFKVVNDSFGHSAGDELLKAVAQRLRACVRPGDMVARLGGDEFAVMLAKTTQLDAVVTLAQRLIDDVSAPFEVGGRRVHTGASVGVAFWDGDSSVDELMLRADTALYDAKESGRGRHTVYSPQLGARSRRRLAVEDGLREAIGKGELALHWQPRVDIDSGEILGAEALMRWTHPVLGRVPPVEFIAVAETCGLIDDLGLWALRIACEAAAGPLAGLQVSVNVSPLQLRSGQFVAHVRDALREFRLPPAQLELELTESVFMGDTEGALAQLHALRSLGVRVALDDFGTGYSSLAYLRRFPFDTLKIDRAFVGEVLHRDDARAIVETIVQLAATLGMRTVCEGVETGQQLAAVAKAGCDEFQGYLASAPQALPGFMQLRQDWRGSELPLALH